MISVKKIFTADLFKVSFLNAIAVFIKMVASVVSMKVVASMAPAGTGPAAIALLGQLNNFATILMGVCNGGITTGMTRYIAEHSASPKKNQLFLGTGFWITTVLSVVIGITLIIGAGYFSGIILKSSAYKGIFYIFGSTIILYAYNSLLVAVINGFKEYKKYVIVNILGSVTGLLFTILLSWKWGTYGALVSVVTYQSVVFLLSLSLLGKTTWFRWKQFTRKFSKFAAIRLSHYSLMALVTAVVIPASQLIVRNYITSQGVTREAGLHEAGIWEGINRVSNMYLLVFATSLGVYYLPRLTELKTTRDLRQEVFSVYKLVLPFLLLFSVALYVARHLIINILLTSEFSEMESLFRFQLLGDFIKMSGWILAYIMTAKSMTRTFIIMEFVSSLAQIGFNIIFINLYGTAGAPMGYAAGHLLYTLCMVFIFRKILFLKSNA